jgi:hypothetical protein
MEIEQYETYCTACTRRLGFKGQQSTRATAALVLGLLPLFTGCVPLSIPAVILGHMELAAIRDGTAPAAGKNLALGGVIVGYLGIALMIFFGLFFAAIAFT